jgi:hypothetical protein
MVGDLAMREQIDCTSENFAATLKLFPAPQMWAGYLTGTPNIQYSDTQWNALPSDCTTVTIDQGYQSPATTIAMVRDVEPGAWLATEAVNKGNWDTARPTIYCDETDLVSVIGAGWRGDVWLALPSNVTPSIAPIYPGITIVAQQWDFASLYDRSIVFDSYWPNNPPIIQSTQEQEVLILRVTGDTNTYLFDGSNVHHVASVADENAFVAAGIKVVDITPAQIAIFTGLVEAGK